MPSITRERTGFLLRGLFEILAPEPDGLPAKVALARLAQQVVLTEYEAGTYGAGDRRFETIVRYATIDAVKAGWMTKSKGHWALTEAGRGALQRLVDSNAFYREAVRLYRAWKASQSVDEAEATVFPVEPVPDRSASEALERAEEQAWAEIERYLANMPPYDLQELVAGLFRGMKYHVDWVAPPGRDGGIDIVAFSDPLGTKPPRIKVQVKRQQTRVPVEGVRAFLGVLGDGDVGIFVNTGGFTQDAWELARHHSRHPVTLIDLERLFDLWVEHYPELSEEARGLLPMRPVHFLAPAA